MATATPIVSPEITNSANTPPLFPSTTPLSNDSIVTLNLPISIKLTNSNFLAWKSQILPVLHGYNLMRFINSPPLPRRCIQPLDKLTSILNSCFGIDKIIFFLVGSDHRLLNQSWLKSFLAQLPLSSGIPFSGSFLVPQDPGLLISSVRCNLPPKDLNLVKSSFNKCVVLLTNWLSSALRWLTMRLSPTHLTGLDPISSPSSLRSPQATKLSLSPLLSFMDCSLLMSLILEALIRQLNQQLFKRIGATALKPVHLSLARIRLLAQELPTQLPFGPIIQPLLSPGLLGLTTNKVILVPGLSVKFVPEQVI